MNQPRRVAMPLSDENERRVTLDKEVRDDNMKISDDWKQKQQQQQKERAVICETE